MFTIDKINITQYGQSTVTLSNDLGTGEMTLRLSSDQANEVEKLVREMLATAMRMPIIKEKLEAAKAVSPMAPPPAEIKTPTGTASFTPDGYKPDNSKPGTEPDFKSCAIHGSYVGDYCYECAANEESLAERARGMKPSDRLDDDIPF